MKAIHRYLKRLRARIKENRKVFILYTILRVMVLAAMIRSIIIHNYEGAATCLLVLALLLIPSFLEGALKIQIPPLFEAIIYCFIFAAEILGELAHYYTKIPIWDTMLHTLNGFLFAAVGFATVDLLNRTSKSIKLSPLYLTMVAFCFSMTIGVLWEFLECSADLFLGQDMQKDFIISNFQSCTLDPTHSQTVIHVEDVTQTVIHTASGKDFVIDGGYLDIGILDTMKDLLVNLIGAVVFCTFGFIYLRNENNPEKGKIAASVVEGLRIQPVAEAEDESGADAENGAEGEPGADAENGAEDESGAGAENGAEGAPEAGPEEGEASE